MGIKYFLQIFLILMLVVEFSESGRKGRKKKKRNRRVKEIKTDSVYIEKIPEDLVDEVAEKFTMDNLHLIAVNPRDQIEFNVYYDPNVNGEDSYLMLSFLVKEQGNILFQIMDLYNNTVIYSIKNNSNYIAKLKYKKKESLKLIFRNLAYNTYAKVIVGFGCQNCVNDNTLAQSDDVQKSVKKLKNINQLRSKIFFISEILKTKQRKYLSNLQSAHNKLYYYASMEIFIVVLINLVQIFTIKNLITKKTLF